MKNLIILFGLLASLLFTSNVFACAAEEGLSLGITRDAMTLASILDGTYEEKEEAWINANGEFCHYHGDEVACHPFKDLRTS